MPAPKARATLQRQLDCLEWQGVSPPTDTAIARNVLALGGRLGLTAVERDILHLTALQRLVSEFDSALENCGRLTRVFIASTNLVNSLDAASLCRFDSHVRLGYLRSDQAVGIFVEMAAGISAGAFEV